MCISFNILKRFAYMDTVFSISPNHQRLYEIAERQAGYFTAAQAQAAGFSRPLLSYYTKMGRFNRIRWGIYRLVQFPGSPDEDLFVAWLRTGPNSVISHESALAVYELSDALPSEIHMIVPQYCFTTQSRYPASHEPSRDRRSDAASRLAHHNRSAHDCRCHHQRAGSRTNKASDPRSVAARPDHPRKPADPNRTTRRANKPGAGKFVTI